jgi:hypothetical protein
VVHLISTVGKNRKIGNTFFCPAKPVKRLTMNYLAGRGDLAGDEMPILRRHKIGNANRMEGGKETFSVETAVLE